MAEEKNLPLPEKELPPPHDMLLSPESKHEGLLNPESKKDEGLLSPESKHEGLLNPESKKDEGQSNSGSKPPGNTVFSRNWEKFGSKKWLLPLLAFIGILILIVGVSAVLDAQDGGRSRSEKRQDRREKKQERKDKKKDRKQNKNKNNKNKKSKDGKNAKATADAGWTTFSYGTGENRIIMQYPGNMKVNTGNEQGGIYGQTQVVTITFTDNQRTVKMQIVPNPNNLSLPAWHDQLAKERTQYATATEQVNGKELALLQSVSDGTMAAFMTMPSNSILWMTMTYSGNADAAYKEFVEILKTVLFGDQPSGNLPSLPANQGTTQ